MKWIKKFIDYKEMSVLSFEKSLDTRSTIDKAIKTNSNLRSDFLAKIIETYPEINPYWLLTGKGEMLNTFDEEGVVSTINSGATELDAISARSIGLHIFENPLKFKADPTFQRVLESITKDEIIKGLREELARIDTQRNQNKIN